MEKIYNKSPSISEIIPLYNKGLYIERAIQSVITQGIQDFGMVVVEGDLTDH
jgi:glycosyltransferase involved in cell wall biosynthesis